MPRFNVEHNGKWACYSTISESFVTSFMAKIDYEEWRIREYGRINYVPAERSNIMTIAEAVASASLNKEKADVIASLVGEAGLSQSEAEELWEKYRDGEKNDAN